MAEDDGRTGNGKLENGFLKRTRLYACLFQIGARIQDIF